MPQGLPKTQVQVGAAPLYATLPRRPLRRMPGPLLLQRQPPLEICRYLLALRAHRRLHVHPVSRGSIALPQPPQAASPAPSSNPAGTATPHSSRPAPPSRPLPLPHPRAELDSIYIYRPPIPIPRTRPTCPPSCCLVARYNGESRPPSANTPPRVLSGPGPPQACPCAPSRCTRPAFPASRSPQRAASASARPGAVQDRT